MSSMPNPPKPYILMCASPFTGHVTPLLAIGKGLLSRGYKVGILTGTNFAPKCPPLEFFPLPPSCDFDECALDVRFPGRGRITDPHTKATTSITDLFMDPIIPQHHTIQSCLQTLSSILSVSTELIIFCDFAFLGVIPSMLTTNASVIKPKGCISICLMPLGLSSIDLPPFGVLETPEFTPAAKKRYQLLHEEASLKHQPTQQDFTRVITTMNITPTSNFKFSFLDTMAHLSDFYLQLGMPSLEYPRSDLPSNFKFAGAVPSNSSLSEKEALKLSSILEIGKGKKIVAVAQSTLQEIANKKDLYNKLVIPTINALSSQASILLIAVLARKGASLPSTFVVPENTKVMDFIPFDALLPHIDCFVYEGGFGGVLHALKNGVPVVVAGGWGDKPEVALRVERSGLGINLKTGTPSEGQIEMAVMKVLGDKGFKERAVELQREVGEIDSVGVVEECVESIMRK